MPATSFSPALAASDLIVGRWARRDERTVAGSSSATDLPALTQTPLPLYSLAAKTTLTVAIVFLMVVKPSLFP